MESPSILGRLFTRSRGKILSLSFLALLAATATAQTGPSVSNPQPLEQNGVSFVDPNGLEADGAGAVEGNVKLENTDLTLQIIWVALALGLMVLVMTDESGDHSNQSPREPLARNDWTVVTDHGHE